MDLPSPSELKRAYPLAPSLESYVHLARERVRLTLSSPNQFLFVVGPCSIYNIEATLEYAKRFKKLSEEMPPHICLVLRVYIEKPRSKIGWKGFLYQPHPHKPPNLLEGLHLSRKLFLTLTEMEIPLGIEFVDPMTSYYFNDLISWSCVGARTCHSQIHRQLASHLPFPVGFKNSIEGNIEGAIQGIFSASSKHHFFGVNDQGKLCAIDSKGNSYCHLVLRGSLDGTNYNNSSISSAISLLSSYHLPTDRIMIDCCHGNSKKNLRKQEEVFMEVIKNITPSSSIKGIMCESFLKEGHQSPFIPSLDPQLSITDPCLGWETTRELLLWASDKLLQMHYPSYISL